MKRYETQQRSKGSLYRPVSRGGIPSISISIRKVYALPHESLNRAELITMAQLIRQQIIQMVEAAQSGHPGASLSSVEIVTALYFSVMNIDPLHPEWDVRDRFVLSKGHATPVLYAALAWRGFFPVEELSTFRQINSRLQGHPDMKKTPGVDMTTGSLGQGFASAVGMALGLQRKAVSPYVYALLGDGELNEGIIWEAAMIASHYQTDHLIAIVDKNGKQASGNTMAVIDMKELTKKWEAFGWNALEIDGHDFGQICRGIKRAKACRGKPSVLIAHTVKGKGISFMERGNEFYGEKLSPDDIQSAKRELRVKGG